MGDEQDRALSKPAPQGFLHPELCPQVHSSSGLIQDEDLGFPEKCTCQAQELLLPHTVNDWENKDRSVFICTSWFIGMPTNGPQEQLEKCPCVHGSLSSP